MAKRPPAAQTAFGPMVIVAIEQHYPPLQRLVHDAIAVRLLPASLAALVAACRWGFARDLFIRASDRRAPGVWGGLLGRKRYADDRVATAIDDGFEQVVILGSGLDTRAYRFVLPAGRRAFEIDLPPNVAYKQRRVQAIYGRLPEHVALVPADFETDDVPDELARHGFRLDQPALFVWEAVTQYLREDGVRRTLAFLSQSSVGSRLLFTYVRADFLDGANLYGARQLYQQFVASGIWRFGLEPNSVAGLLREYGWAEREQVGRAEYLARYVAPSGRELAVSEIERFVYAEKR